MLAAKSVQKQTLETLDAVIQECTSLFSAEVHFAAERLLHVLYCCEMPCGCVLCLMADSRHPESCSDSLGASAAHSFRDFCPGKKQYVQESRWDISSIKEHTFETALEPRCSFGCSTDLPLFSQGLRTISHYKPYYRRTAPNELECWEDFFARPQDW